MTDLVEWTLRRGLESDDLGAILSGLSHRLLEQGIPLCRVTLSMPTIDPTAFALTYEWWRDTGLVSDALALDGASAAAFHRSTISHLLRQHTTAARWSLEDQQVVRQFALFEELRARGLTDYALQMVLFSQGRTALQGAALSMATDRLGGFTQDEVDAVRRLLPALSVVAYRIGLLRVATQTLGAYVGPQTGQRVLQGMIRRGDVQTLSAALLLADLRGFTALVDRAATTEVVRWLNQHFECIGDWVTDHGGEVLKFLGDGLLAVFPAEGREPEPACRQALAAATDARTRNTSVNMERSRVGEPVLDLSVALHFGDVVYGNIGTARRLDFTVIGPAVNELSRMEALGKSLGRELLLSDSFARRCGRPTVSLGPHELRGITAPREIHVVAT
jgi:adenylate cyclase